MSDLLRFSKPALEWLEGLPLGNGITAAMLWGSLSRTILSLNHVDFWRDEVDEEVPDYAYHTAEIRRLLMAGLTKEANDYIKENIIPIGLPVNKRPKYHDLEGKTNSFEPVGNLVVEVHGQSEPVTCKRSLDISKGIASIEYYSSGNSVRQECLISAEQDALFFRVTADKPVSGVVRFDREAQDLYKWMAFASGDEIAVDGVYVEGVRSFMLAKLSAKDGEVRADGNSLAFTNVSDMVLTAVVEVGRAGDDTEGRCRSKLMACSTLSCEETRLRHFEEHISMFERVDLHLSEQAEADVDTDVLLAKAVEGEYKNELAELVFQFGRYLMMSCSRAGRRPANLQGIWNDNNVPMWGADYHFDMNVQMNQWLCNPTNLDECNLALFSQVERLMDQGRQIAGKITGCGGVLFDLIAGGDGMNWNCYSMWTGAAAWLAQHFWTHYEYTLDTDFLRECVYPFTREVGLFYKDFLVKDQDGYYVAPPSFSPENFPTDGHRHNMHCTMDTALVREVMRHLITASEILDVDYDLRPVWQDLHDNVHPYQISKEGVLKEWPEPLLERAAHRHYSHLYPLFPGDEFTRDSTPGLFKASREAVRLRESPGRAHNFGWSYPYLALLYSRFGEGDNALENLHCLARSVTVDNLLTCGCDWRDQGYTVQWSFNVDRLFQIEAAFGATAAIAEMLLQSHEGFIRLLPALPSKWNSGSFKGLKARGAFVVDACWKDSRITTASITSLKGQHCRVVCSTPWESVEVAGEVSSIYRTDGIISFPTEPGKRYDLSFR